MKVILDLPRCKTYTILFQEGCWGIRFYQNYDYHFVPLDKETEEKFRVNRTISKDILQLYKFGKDKHRSTCFFHVLSAAEYAVENMDMELAKKTAEDLIFNVIKKEQVEEILGVPFEHPKFQAVFDVALKEFDARMGGALFINNL